MMEERWPYRGVELCLMFLWLPLALADKSKHKAVRLLGFAAFFLWFIPAMAIIAIPMLLLMLASIAWSFANDE